MGFCSTLEVASAARRAYLLVGWKQTPRAQAARLALGNGRALTKGATHEDEESVRRACWEAAVICTLCGMHLVLMRRGRGVGSVVVFEVDVAVSAVLVRMR